MLNENKNTGALNALSRLGRSPLFIVAVIMYAVFLILCVVAVFIKPSVVDGYGSLMALDIIDISIRCIALIGFIIVLTAALSANKGKLLSGLSVIKLFCAVYGVFTVIDSLLSSISTVEDLTGQSFIVPIWFFGWHSVEADLMILVPCLQICLTVIRVIFYFMISSFVERISQTLRTGESMPEDGIGLFIFMLVVGCSYTIEGIFNFDIIMYPVYLVMCVLLGIWIFKYRKTMTEVYYSYNLSMME